MHARSIHHGARRAASALAPFIVLGALAAGAQGQAYEPNDSGEQAHGPLVGGQDYAGATETSNDVDFFYFNTSGQVQLDIAATGLSGACETSGSRLYLYDAAGQRTLGSASIAFSDSAGPRTGHILYSAPGRRQYLLKADTYTGCQYRLRIDPPAAVTTESPGVTATLGATEDPDDVQVLTLNGQEVGRSSTTERVIDLGPLPPDSRVGLDALNSSGRFSWNFAVTNLEDRRLTTLVSETQEGGSSSSPRVGVVRHVVLDPAGSILETCGERVAQTPCIPPPIVDNDKDGVPAGPDCNDASASVRPGVPEILDNAVDENCDGVAERRTREGATVSLKRRGATFSGRVAGSSWCVSGRRVVLRKTGAGTRSYGSALVRSNGTFTIRRSRRLRASVHVVLARVARAAVVRFCSRQARAGPDDVSAR